MNVNPEQMLEMKEEANKIKDTLETQKLDHDGINTFAYALFIIVAISMVFEFFVKSYREEKRNRKLAGKPNNDIKGKLLITYGVHVIVTVIIWLICENLLKLTGVYTGFLIAITIYIVEIAPLFTIHLNLKKKEENK